MINTAIHKIAIALLYHIVQLLKHVIMYFTLCKDFFVEVKLCQYEKSWNESLSMDAVLAIFGGHVFVKWHGENSGIIRYTRYS